MRFLCLLFDVILTIAWGILFVATIFGYEPNHIIVIIACYYAARRWVGAIIADYIKLF